MKDVFDSEKSRAATWFRQLRDEIVAAFERLEDNHAEVQQSVEAEVKDLLSTVASLRKFHHSDVQKELEDFAVRDSSTTPRIVVGFSHASKPLNSFDPKLPSAIFVIPSSSNLVA